MLAHLEEFAQLLRKNRVRVSVGEVVDAVHATAAVGLERPEDLRAALAATLVKTPGDLRVFDELFSLYFLRGADFARDLSGTPLVKLLEDMGLGEEDIERMLAILGDQAAALGAVARGAMGLRSMDISALLRMAGVATTGGGGMRISSPLQVGYHTQRVLNQLDLGGAERELDAVVRLLGKAVGEAQAEALRQALLLNLGAIRQAIRKHVQEEFEKQNMDFFEQFRARTLSEKPFQLLSEAEIEKLRAEVRKLARKLRAQASLRPKVRRRGRLDVRRTLRRSLRTGGVPFDLIRRTKRVERPRLVILCDVSDSVRNVSRFMLELVFTLQELFDRVRSFVFVSDLGETTDLFRTYDLEQAVQLAYSGAVISVQSNSNYGRALEQFCDKHLDAVTSKTTVIVIGDARNNYNPPNADRLSSMRRRAKRLLWLNPELPGAWGFGDSAMRDYEPHCDKVVVAYNLESLRKVVDDLVL